MLSGLALGLLRSRSFTSSGRILPDNGGFHIEYLPDIHSGPIAGRLSLLEKMHPPGFAFRIGQVKHAEVHSLISSRAFEEESMI